MDIFSGEKGRSFMRKFILAAVFSVFFACGIYAGVKTPGNLVITYDGSAMNIVWDASSVTYTVNYVVYRSTYQNAAPADYTATLTGNAAFVDPSVNSCDAYYYSVQAIAAVSGEQSATSTAKNTNPRPPLPADITVMAQASSSALLQWNTSDASVTGYKIYRSTDIGTAFSGLKSLASNSYTDVGLNGPESYQYRITSISAGKEGAYSAVKTLPGYPSDVYVMCTLTSSTTSDMTIAWVSSTAATTPNYNVYRSTNPAFDQTNADVMFTANTTFYDDTGTDTLTAYYYRVQPVFSGTETGPLSPARGTNPRPPVSLAVQPMNSKVFLTWAPSPDGAVTMYNIYRSSDGGAHFVTPVAVNAYQYLDVDAIANGISYAYKVSSTNTAQGRDGASTPLQFLEPFAAPFAPKNLSAIVSSNVVTLTWSASMVRGTYDVTGYNVYRLDPVASSIVQVADNTPYLALSDTVTVQGQEYDYVVRTRDINGYLSISATAAVFVEGGVIPAPQNLTKTARTSGLISLSWTSSAAPLQIDGFRVYRDNISYVSYVPVTAFTDIFTSLNLGDSHTYYVTAFKGAQESASSNTTDAISVIPAAPLILSVSRTGTGRPWMSWANPQSENATIFNVYRATDPVSVPAAVPITFTTANYTAAVNFTDLDSALVPGTLYYYAIAGVKYNGITPVAGDLTNTFSVRYISAPVSPPDITSRTGTAYNSFVTLTWTADILYDATSYTVYRSQNNVDYVNSGTTTRTSRVIGSLTNEAPWFFKVVSTNEVGTSNTFTADAISLMPSASLSRDVTDVGGTAYNGYVYLSWTANDAFAETAYTVYRSIDNNVTYSNISVTAYNAMTITAGISNGTTYYFKITSSDADGAYSDTFNALYYSMTPAASLLLDQPQGLTLTSAGDGVLGLSWLAVPGSVSYNIFRSNSIPPPLPSILLKNVTTTVYNDVIMTTLNASTLSDTTTYYYTVAGMDSQSVTGQASNIAVSGSAFVAPGAPADAGLSDIYDGVLLTWKSPDNLFTYQPVTGYNIYRRDPGSSIFNMRGYTTGYYFEDMGINTYSASYDYKILPVDSMGNNGAVNSTYSITTDMIKDPPGVLFARPGDKAVTLIWTKVSPNSYNIYRSTIPGVYGAPVAYGIVFDQKQYTDQNSGLVNKNTYYYTIAAVTNMGEGPRSMEVSAMPYTPASVLGISAVTVAILNKKDVLLAWTPAIPGDYPISGYNVYRSHDDGANYTLLTTTVSTVTTYIDTATDWDNTYFYMIKVLDGNLNEDAVYDIASVALPLPTNRLRLYRNMVDLKSTDAAANKLKWQYVIIKNGKVRVTVHTLNGSYVKTLLDTAVTGDLSPTNPFQSDFMYWDGTNAAGKQVASGVYLLIMELEGSKTVAKVAVIK
jgi:fibronectin type 3 domain-containing protein